MILAPFVLDGTETDTYDGAYSVEVGGRTWWRPVIRDNANDILFVGIAFHFTELQARLSARPTFNATRRAGIEQFAKSLL